MIGTAQADEIVEAESFLNGVPIRTGAAFRIRGPLDVDRLAWAWAEYGERISRDSGGHRLFTVDPLEPPDATPIDESTLDARDRAALAEPGKAALFSRLYTLDDGSVAWSVFVHHAVLDGVGLVHHMAAVRALHDDGDAAWPYATWESSRATAATMLTHRRKAQARVRDLVADPAVAAPVLIGARRRSPTVPRVASLGTVPGKAGDGPLPSLAHLCGFTALLLLAATGEDTVQLSVPRAGVSRTGALPLGTFAYTLPLVVRRPDGGSLAEFGAAVEADLRYNRWSRAFRTDGLRSSAGPNVNLFPAGTGAGLTLLSSGPVEDLDVVAALADDGDLQVWVQIGMEGLDAADFALVRDTLRELLAVVAAADPDTPVAEVLDRVRRGLAPVRHLGRELDARACSGGGPATDAVRAVVADVLRARLGDAADPEDYDFFDSGGSSADAVALSGDLSVALGRPLDPALLYYFPSFDELVTGVARTEGPGAGWAAAATAVIDTGSGPATGARVDRLVRELLHSVTGGDPALLAHPGGLLAVADGDAGPVSCRAAWPDGGREVRIDVRAAAVDTGAIEAALRNAAAVSGAGRVAHTTFAEVTAR